MEIHKHFIDANGNHFVAPFASQEHADGYVPPAGAVEIEPRPSPDHHWQGGGWVYVEPPPPSADEIFPPLDPWRFWSVIELSGIGEQNVRSAIALIDDQVFKVTAIAKLNNPPGGKYHRSDPLFSNPFLMMRLNLTAEEIDSLWLQAAALE